MSLSRRCKIFIIGAISSLMFMECSSSSSETEGDDQIKLGLLGPFSGTLKSYGQELRNGAQLAADEINEAGGVLGKQIKLISADSATTDSDVTSAFSKLIEEEVLAVIGPATSGVALKAIEVVKKQKLTLISPSASSPELSTVEDDNLFWRTIPSDVFQGKIAAEYAYDEQNLANKTAAVLHIDNSYGAALAKVFKEQFEKKGGKVLSVEKYPEKSDEEMAKYTFEEEAPRLFKDEPDIIFMITYYMDGIQFTLQAKNYFTDNYQPKFLGCDGNKGQVFIDQGDPQIIDSMQGTSPAPATDDPNYIAFAKKYKEKFGWEPELGVEGAYDAVYLYAYSMIKAKKVSKEVFPSVLREISGPEGKIINVGSFTDGRAALEKGEDINYEGASGKVDWDEKGDVTSANIEIWKVLPDGEKKKFTTLKNIHVL